MISSPPSIKCDQIPTDDSDKPFMFYLQCKKSEISTEKFLGVNLDNSFFSVQFFTF